MRFSDQWQNVLTRMSRMSVSGESASRDSASRDSASRESASRESASRESQPTSLQLQGTLLENGAAPAYVIK
jgi:hypothetical protein